MLHLQMYCNVIKNNYLFNLFIRQHLFISTHYQTSVTSVCMLN